MRVGFILHKYLSDTFADVYASELDGSINVFFDEDSTDSGRITSDLHVIVLTTKAKSVYISLSNNYKPRLFAILYFELADIIKNAIKSGRDSKSSKSRRGTIICFTTSKLSPMLANRKLKGCLKDVLSEIHLWEGSLKDVSSEIKKEVLSKLMEYTRRNTKATGISDFNCHKVAIAKLDNKDFTLLLPIEVKRKNI
ncbi:10546_t:CDS:2 [Funneliformis caledonium]|uniref:10546_t:CDS:1 n=1 Tax=Funneliformis caledonium TaxID=1117310 RepID=A0A9N9E9N8_9GLOM|nr:10546_t:CDS:2 [Funneliformis caledonium]